MNSADLLLKSTLGEGFLESLAKPAELFKPGTKTVLDPEEIRIGLKVVPRVVMSLLISELSPMEVNSHKTIQLPFGKKAHMNVTKGDRDSYTGSVFDDGKQVYDFMNRSIPGLGIILLSTFELYAIEELEKDHKHGSDVESVVQKLIDERMEQRALITKVVDQKMSEREAVHKIIMAKLTEAIHQPAPVQHTIAPLPVSAVVGPINVVPSDIVKKEDKAKKALPLKSFLERKKPKEHHIEIMKSESVLCPDCGQVIFGDCGLSTCICYGPDQNRKIWLKKTEDGVKISFSKSWDPENISMLLEVLRRKND
jgi:hypothetical protein